MQHLKVNDKVQIKQTCRTGTVVNVGVNKEYIEIYYDDADDHQWYNVDKLELIPSKEFKFKLGDKVQDKSVKHDKAGEISNISTTHFTITWVYGLNKITHSYEHSQSVFFELAKDDKPKQPDKVSKQKDIVYIELKNLCLVYLDNKMYDEAKEIIDVLHKLNKHIKLEIRGLS